MKMTMRTAFLFLLITGSFLSGIVLIDAGAKESEKRWSFTFGGCPVADAFGQIEKTTKYKITLIGKTYSAADRTYKNQTVEKIVQDILRNDNYALTTSPNENSPGTIVIRLTGSAEDSSSPPVPEARPGMKSPPMPPGVPRRR